jgi:hypothetical protein
MSAAKIADVLARQQELIAALDAQDVDRIVLATEALAVAAAALRGNEPWPQDSDLAEELNDALRANAAATMRINLFRHWTRQRIDHLQDLRRGQFRRTDNKSI